MNTQEGASRLKARPRSEEAFSWSSGQEDLEEKDAQSEEVSTRSTKRIATVYDAVAGRVGFNGFLTDAQLQTGTTALTPEEVLFRRNDAPSKVPHDFYSAAENLRSNQQLPDADLLKTFHSYASDFYRANSRGQSQQDFKSLDETALLAVGILLEEASREAFGENGDMVLVEPESLGQGLPESDVVKYQVKGRVKPLPSPEYASEAEEESDGFLLENEPRNFKKRRH